MHKKPWTLLAIVLTLAMVAGAMSWGAVKYWSDERNKVTRELTAMETQLQKRMEIVHNILIVASRHLTNRDAAVMALASDIDKLEGDGGLEVKISADHNLTSHARAVLAALEATDAGSETSFDFNYVNKRFPQELDQSQEGVIDAYLSTIKLFNSNLSGSVSGTFARAMGISPIGEGIALKGVVSSQVALENGKTVSVPDGLLSENTLKDIDRLNSQLEDTGFRFVVAAQHFIGGSNVQSYTDNLFKEQGLDDKAVLLFMAIGEQRYGIAAGTAVKKVLPDEDAKGYLAGRFRTPFMEHQYDTAVGGFLLAAGSKIAEEEGVKFSKAGLFGTREEKSTPSAGWWNDFLQGSASDAQTYDASQYGNTETNGFSIPSIAIIGFVLYLIFGRKRGVRQGRGCGCGPLGWIFGALGIANLFGLRKH